MKATGSQHFPFYIKWGYDHIKKHNKTYQLLTGDGGTEGLSDAEKTKHEKNYIWNKALLFLLLSLVMTPASVPSTPPPPFILERGEEQLWAGAAEWMLVGLTGRGGRHRSQHCKAWQLARSFLSLCICHQLMLVLKTWLKAAENLKSEQCQFWGSLYLVFNPNVLRSLFAQDLGEPSQGPVAGGAGCGWVLGVSPGCPE